MEHRITQKNSCHVGKEEKKKKKKKKRLSSRRESQDETKEQEEEDDEEEEEGRAKRQSRNLVTGEAGGATVAWQCRCVTSEMLHHKRRYT